MEFKRGTRQKKAVNIISLVDVLLFLAIFLMLCTSFAKNQAIDVSMGNRLDGTDQMASLSNAIDSEEVNAVKVTVAEKTVALDDVRYSRKDFAVAMREMIIADPTRRISVITDDSADVQALIDVIDILRLQGASNVNIDHN